MCRMCLVEVDTGRGPSCRPSCMVTVAPDMKVDTESPIAKRVQEGMHRAAARQPSPRLPGVRQGRRVPAAGPVVQPRPRREPLHRGEASLREADPDQRSRAPRSRALHPVRSLHPLRRRGRRRRADPLHPAAATTTQINDLPRRAVRQLLQRQHRADLPGRRAHRQAVPVQGPPVGPRADREHVHHVRRRLPHRRAVEPRRAVALPGRRQRAGQLGLAVRSRPVRLRGVEQPRALAAPLVRVGDELRADHVERARWHARPS